MDLKRLAAVVTLTGGAGTAVCVGFLAGLTWGLLAGCLLLMAAGIASLRSMNG